MTNLAHIAETALLLLAAYLLGCAMGYAAHRILHAGRGTRQVTTVAAVPPVAAPVPAPPERRRPAARLAASVEDLPLAEPVAAAKPIARKPAPETPVGKPHSKAKSPGPKPATLAVPRVGGADNLKKIKGIGPKIEASLHAMGIFHIDQIAGWNKANIDWIEAELAFKGRVRRERWVEQAMDLGKVKASA
jgi:NADH-quinone oxidoreductase subunit E